MKRAAIAAFLSFINVVLCVLTNVSIDDTDGDPITGQKIIYDSPTWSFGPSCEDCEAIPTPASSAFLGTWHDTTFLPGNGLVSATALFTGDFTSSPTNRNVLLTDLLCGLSGSAVYVMCILTGTAGNPDGNTDMTFFLDNERVANFSRAPDGDASYQFNVPVFSMDGLSMTQHNITLVSGMQGQAALVLLDRVIYT